MNSSFSFRLMESADLDSVAEIYNQGIEERVATFETGLRSGGDLMIWLSTGYPVVVGLSDGRIVSFAAAHSYSSRECYRGVGEFSVYVGRNHRGLGFGRATMIALIDECRKRGLWKLVSRVFPENLASRRMLESLGFREVGVYKKHARLDGIWRDVVIVEYLIDQNQDTRRLSGMTGLENTL